ncbi:L-aspartate oxidase [Neobacillus sp. DY30]|uniref:L-aspartate oxidase n=1 Tax=Neobacillus sp. DY30 TaxID=3047871 RepID=UPI0024BF1448|nr:L-aspartate oxidase [Neobacillus sp. DY30]WHX99458.1 L-aspartate oxidase [Neobacillus sp. DY30]
MTINDDVLILGSGIAALQLASLLNKDLNVRILTKAKIRTANSYLAQGGIAAAIGEHDHPNKHIADTFEAGRYHNNQEAVEQIIHAAPRLIKFISEQGSVFDKNQDGELLLGMEGAHSEKRIVHGGGDATGKNVVEYLIGTLKENVTVEEEVFAYELLLNSEKRCIGVKAKMPDGTQKNYYSRNTILATGGCGQLFTYTSNAETVSGDGIAMAYLAGAEVVDMEFIQFHPTLLYLNGETKGLISEAVRGEGAVLVTEDGTPIMEGVHPLKDLGPRHVVSQKIYEYLKNGYKVYLDISKIENFKQRFPSITAICEDNGLQLSDGRIPVAPGSHFLMGGIKTDLFGRTSIKGLFAIGEAACTGLHGANRLASNSLLEGLYMGEKLSNWLNQTQQVEFLGTAFSRPYTPQEKVILPDLQEIKDTMMERVGIIRNEANLRNQKVWLDSFNVCQINNLELYSIEEMTKIFMLINANLITEAALKRTESRGGHFRSDYPVEDEHYWLNKTINHKNSRGMESNHEYIETALAT